MQNYWPDGQDSDMEQDEEEFRETSRSCVQNILLRCAASCEEGILNPDLRFELYASVNAIEQLDR